jgi:hypothetical protein
MPQTFENPEVPENKREISPLTIGMGVVVAAAILVSLWFLFEPQLSRKRPALQQTVKLSMGSAEQEYARRIEIGNIALSRAENFLHQEVTTLNGEVHNGGTQPVLALSLTLEFSDDMKQVVLRESRKVLGAPEAALAPGEHRAFEISFDHLPSSWNMQAPAMRVSYIELAQPKQ